ncbi:hypothetical protein ACJMK2_028823 [Sinanodonta woodiana]|uniref:Uncharacterized protein n=1 Tax=Sinanodonta woodiana TaxID=1069815 RepID=A0ABD3X8C1_SINWO
MAVISNRQHFRQLSHSRPPLVVVIQLKMALIQEELLDLKVQLECSGYKKNMDSDVKLITKIETLKEQFRELLVELRRRKAAELESAVLVSEEENIEDDDEFDVPRGRFRRRAMSVSSRLSTTSVSSSIRPLAATPVTPDTQDSPLLFNEKHVPYKREKRNLPPAVGNYVGSMATPSLSKDKLEILELSYSPSVERKFRKK